MLDRLTVGDFGPLVGDTFAAPGSVALELVAAEPLGSPPPDDAPRAPFRLEWRGPAEPVVPSELVALEHPTLGSVELLITAVGRGPDGGLRYEAIFG